MKSFIKNKKQDGFSLIELLVVVAIIGVLSAVGIVGYQGYLDSTRQGVVEANADSVERWLQTTSVARGGGLPVDPAACIVTATATTCGTAISNLTTGPFAGFENPYGGTNVFNVTYGGAAAVCTTATGNNGSINIRFTPAATDNLTNPSNVTVNSCAGETASADAVVAF